MVGILTGPGYPVPPQAAAAGYLHRTFFDDFLSTNTIDLAGAGDPSKLWFLNTAWPHIDKTTQFFNGMKTSGASNPANFSVASSILTISTQTGTTGLEMATCQAAGAGSVGRSFGGGAYFEALVQYDVTLAKFADRSTGQWPAFWALPLEYLTGATNVFVEPDFFEAFPTADGAADLIMTTHQWDMNAGSDSPNPDNFIQTADSNWHKIGILWVPASKNGGTGFLQRYVDDVHHSSADVTWAPGGTYSVMDGQNFMINFVAGANWPINIDYVAVWQ